MAHIDIDSIVAAIEAERQVQTNPTRAWLASLPADELDKLKRAIRAGIPVGALIRALKEQGAEVGSKSFYDWAREVKREH